MSRRSPLRAAPWAIAGLIALPAPARAQGCTNACVPLIDLGPTSYQGFQGGLYPKVVFRGPGVGGFRASSALTVVFRL